MRPILEFETVLFGGQNMLTKIQKGSLFKNVTLGGMRMGKKLYSATVSQKI